MLMDIIKFLILENYFFNDFNIDDVCVINFVSFVEVIFVCYIVVGNWWLNFLVVDFYKVLIFFCNLGVFMFIKFMDDICMFD